MRVDELDYELPEDRIATRPAQPRDAARLMVAERATGRLDDRQVRDLPGLGVLGAGDLVVVNETRVLPARLAGVRQATGGRVTGLFLAGAGACWQVMLEARGRLEPGEAIVLDERARLVLERSLGQGRWTARLEADAETEAVLQRVGRTPLPPYIARARQRQEEPAERAEDAERYNTVYARQAGSVAAPTAGLHLTPELLSRLQDQGVGVARLTLHVGLGTFAPVRSETLEGHTMHGERVVIDAATLARLAATRDGGGRILAVGTTTLRALESLPEHWRELAGDFVADTELFIYPGCGVRFRFTDMLMTNFHLPRSTLLAMVAALPGVGVERLLGWYREAVRRGYRFYSYGDAMLVA